MPGFWDPKPYNPAPFQPDNNPSAPPLAKTMNIGNTPDAVSTTSKPRVKGMGFNPGQGSALQAFNKGSGGPDGFGEDRGAKANPVANAMSAQPQAASMHKLATQIGVPRPDLDPKPAPPPPPPPKPVAPAPAPVYVAPKPVYTPPTQVRYGQVAPHEMGPVVNTNQTKIISSGSGGNYTSFRQPIRGSQR